MKRKIELSLLALIVITGVFLRFYRLGDFMQFGGDQGRDAFAARDIATLMDVKLVGPPSTTHGGLESGPAYYYIIAFFAKIFKFAPEAGGYAVAFFGALSILLFYFLAKKFFDEGRSLTLTAFYAFSNLIVFYQRFPWNPNLLLFFVLLFWLGFLGYLGESEEGREGREGSRGKRRWGYLTLMGLGFGLGVQMHFTALILLPAAGLVLLLIEKRRLFSKKYLISASYFLLLVFLLHFPYLIYQYQHRFPVVRSVVKMGLLFTGQAQATEGIAKTPYLEQVNQNLAGLTGFVSKLFFGVSSQILGGLMLLAVLIGVIGGIREIRGGKEIRENKIMLGAWLIVSILAYAFYPKGLDEHYFLQMVSAVLLGAGVLVREIGGIRVMREMVMIGVIGVLAGVNLFVVWQQFGQLASSDYLPRYGITLAENKEVVGFILQNRPPAPFSVQMFGESRALSPVGYEYLLSLRGLKPNVDFLGSYRKVDYVFYVVEPKFILEDPAWSAELDARIGHIHEKLAQAEIGNVKVVYAKRPHEIFEQTD